MPIDPTSDEVKSVSLELVAPGQDGSSCHQRILGRPSNWSRKAFIRICRHIEHGFSIPNACAIEGIQYRGFRLRIQRDPRLQKRVTEAEEVRFKFRQEQALASIMAAGEKSWVAHAWFLERSDPNHWALRNVNRPDSEEQQLIEEEIPAETLANHRRLLLELAHEDEQKEASA